ncbi:hypothetical protein [Mesorhizobium sp. M0408]|uniref:hypothetical protein n=1 Tax=Mesorhizobium sp. M0408 TaxID=2956942 RepID=UPI003339BBE7
MMITIIELMGQARIIANINYRNLEPIALVDIFFLVVSVPSIIALNTSSGGTAAKVGAITTSRDFEQRRASARRGPRPKMAQNPSTR